jgi:hypothetical protein
MILLNFTHPLTADQRAAVERLTGQPIHRLIDLPAHFDQTQPFVDQVRALVEAAGLTPEEWQGAPVVVNPPALAAIAVTLLAELHGRMGYFPPAVRLRPVEDALPPRYEVAEIINLQRVRDQARTTRRA